MVTLTAEDVDDFEYELPAASASASSRIVPATSQDYKQWATLYPLYIDVKSTKRRVSLRDAIEFPSARQMAYNAQSLGYQVHLESGKSHPADWVNPGRIKIRIRSGNGQPVNSKYPTKISLLKALASLHPKIKAHQNLQEKFAPNSPALSHGSLQHAINDPKSLLPPEMANMADFSNDAVATPAAIQDATEEGSKSSKNKEKNKGKQKIKIVRR